MQECNQCKRFQFWRGGKLVKTLISTVVLLSFLSAAHAQTDRGSITGTVLDPAGAVVPGASIQAKNSATGEQYSVGTTTTGNYTLANLPAGTYELTVGAMGFKKYVRPGVTVQVAAAVRADVTLEVGAVNDTVTVTAEAPLLKTESGEVSHQVDYTQAEELPLFTLNGSGSEGIGNVRDPLSVLTTLPGADFSTDNVVRINGLPANSQAIRIDGQDATNGVWQQYNQAVQPSVDAIQEVSVQTSSFAAEYGQSGGGYINYTMKSGTNQLHGSAYDYFQNEALNAGLPFTVNSSGTGHVRNPLRRNDYGFTVGGPVRIPKLYNGKDKTFFFFSFEQFRQSTITNNLITTAPMPQWTGGSNSSCATTAAQTCNANFSNVESPLGPAVTAGFNPAAGVFAVPSPTGSIDQIYQIFDPTTAHYVNGGPLGSGIVETPFPNNTIPYSRMNPTSLKEQALFLAPNLGGLVNNELQPAYSNYRHTTIPSFKIDQNLSTKMKISGFYNQTYTYSPNANGLPEILAPTTDQNTRAQTIRINFDDTLAPTVLLHVGVGLVYDNQDQYPPFNNAGQILGWGPNQQYPANNIMPSVAGLSSIFSGGLALGSGFGAPTPGVSAFECCQDVTEIKPTANASTTWVHGNHTFKFGAELIFEGLPTQSSYRANGEYTFSQLETANPWEFTNAEIGPSSVFTSGYPYASFLLGTPDSLVAGAESDSRLGNHQMAFFAQDSWKVSRKLTLEYGLRYDYANLLEEEHGRMQSGCFQCANPNLVPAGSTTPLDGLVVYQKQYNQNYPFAFGPRLGIAYQINSKTVFRGGAGIAYSATSNNYGLSATDIDFQSIIAPKGTGQGIGGACPNCILFSDGNPFAPGNVYGNAPLTFPTTGANYPRQTSATGCGPNGTTACIPPEDPFITIDKGTGRLPRVFQWSVGLQREIIPNLMIEAAYVGNRGAWWESAVLDQEALNGLTPQQLLAERMYGNTTGINVQNPAQAGLLLQPISSPSVIAAFPALANPNVVYNGFPSYEPLLAALVPHPQWYGGVPPFLGPPLGDTWYDSLQVKLTKRYSRGLTVQGAFTWQKELTNGANANTAYLSPSSPIIDDPYCRACSKQLSGLDYPEVLLVTFSYTTPKNKFGGESFGGKALQWLSRDWTIGGVLRYQSGQLLQTPPSENNLVNELIGPGNNPGIWGGSTTLENYVPGQPFFLVNPNSHFDPTTTLALNPNAFTDAPLGTFGVSAPYYNQNRWQRQPAESLSVGRIFRIREKAQLQIRAEFQNVFNRVFYALPADGAGTGTYTAPTYNNPFPVPGSTGGALNAGYGFVNSFNGNGAQPRTGQLVARFTF